MSVDFNWSSALADSPILLVLFACSVFTFAVAIERWIYYRQRGGDPTVLLGELRNMLQGGSGDPAAVRGRCGRHPAARVAMAMVGFMGRGSAEFEERLQIQLSEEKLQLERNIGVLGSMAAVAPLIGLLGTVWGIMRAFGDMAQTGSAAPSVVAAGVSEALVTTAAGLVIAVPSVLLYNYFTRRLNVMLTMAENQTRSLRESAAETSATPLRERAAGPAAAVAADDVAARVEALMS